MRRMPTCVALLAALALASLGPAQAATITVGHGDGYDFPTITEPEQLPHRFEVGLAVGEQRPVTFAAETTQPRLSVGTAQEAVPRALTVAPGEELAATAATRQTPPLLLAECSLPLRHHHVPELFVEQVAETMRSIDELIAGVHRPVALHGKSLAAGLGQHA